MPKKRFSAEQIVMLLRQIEVTMSQGKAAPVACREAGISQQSCATNASTRRSSIA
jgi:putative transposase